MLVEYCKHNSPDGEIIFLAANPNIKAKGIGSMLLRELEEREKGKKSIFYIPTVLVHTSFMSIAVLNWRRKKILH